MTELLAELEAQYCPPLDPALLSAIVSDFDLTNADSIAEARNILDELKASAAEQEDSGFDPTGLSSTLEGGTPNDNDEHSRVGQTESSTAGHTDLTSVSNGLSSLELDGGSDLEQHDGASHQDLEAFLREMQKLNDEDKVQRLHEMFPDSKPAAIEMVLKKCTGDFYRAFDELLNHQYFSLSGDGDGEEKIHAKGIDAFSEDNIGRRTRGGKRKKKVFNHISLDDDLANGQTASIPPSNIWASGQSDIEFISARTHLSIATVTTIYNKHRRSKAETVEAILVDLEKKAGNASQPSSEDDPSLVGALFSLKDQFPRVPASHLTTILRLTSPSDAHARDLASALDAGLHHHTDGKPGSLKLVPNYKTSAGSDTDSTPTTPWTPVSMTRTPSMMGSVSRDIDPNLRAATYRSAQDRALAQASSAYRRGRSDRLMMAAAGYYSQEGRRYAELHREAAGEAADELVASQSSTGQLDLHGVTVRDATRIVRARLETFKKSGRVIGLDGRRGAGEGGGGGGGNLRVIVGLGRHSAGGQSKLGPAVRRVLEDGGWRYEFDQGAFTVHGRS